MDAPDLVDTIRSFNRFYTNWLGLLNRGYLDSGYTLTEARILYELAARDAPAAKDLVEDLGLDAAYLSRILRTFREAGFVESRPDPADQRRQILAITERGRTEIANLAQRSRAQIAAQLSHLTTREEPALTEALQRIERCLSKPDTQEPSFSIRPHRPGDIGWIVHRQTLLYTQEYGWNDDYEGLAAGIAGDFLKHFKPGREFCWIAEHQGAIVGSVFLVEADAETAKLRLLYVESTARGLGVGRALVGECIAFARAAGYRKLTLWTNDVLIAARKLYQAEGFELVAEERHHSFGKDLVGQTWERDLQRHA